MQKLTREIVDQLDSPTAMAQFWGDTSLYDWQRGTIHDVLNGIWTALVTPNEAGKTSVCVADIGLTAMARYPGCQVVSTAGAFRQISEQLWPVVRAKLAPYPEWRVTEEKAFAPSINGLPASTWQIFSTDDPKKAEGHHTRVFKDADGEDHVAPLIYIADEAKSLDLGIFQAIYRCDPDMCLVASTPGEEEGEFFNIVQEGRAFNKKYGPGSGKQLDDKDRPMFKVREVSWADCPHLRIGRKKFNRELLIRQYGPNSPFIMSMVFGQFYRAGGFFIFNIERVDRAMGGYLLQTGNDRNAGIDLASGGDEIPFALRVGNAITELDAITEKDPAKTGRWLETKFRKHHLRPYEITVDEGGLGRAVIGFLEERGWEGINRYNFDDKPGNEAMYMSRGMEDHHKLSLAIERHEAVLPKDSLLREQMRVRKFRMPNGNGGRMALESKEVLRKKNVPSPDRLDAVVMAYSNMPDYYAHRKEKNDEESLIDKFWKQYSDSNRQFNTMHGMRMEQ